jgi:hypothetical protein
MALRGVRGGVLAAVVAAAVCSGTAQAAPASLPSYAQWQSDVKQVIDPAIPWLQDHLDEGGQKPAIVLDIDNTALETGYHPGKPNKPVLAVAQWASDHGVSVLFATARSAGSASETTDQLTSAGYAVDGLCTKESGDSSQGATKQRCRQEYTDDGYVILENIGNHDHDLAGGNYLKGYQLPDYDGQLS